MRAFRRTDRYEKQPEQEQFLREVNRLLGPCEEAFTRELDAPPYATVFLVGTPRCGSTFAAQFFPSVLRLGYVSNLMARFYETPTVGARLQAILLDEPTCERTFRAEHGYTRGIEATHEFGYFWTRWFDFGQTHQVSDEKLARVDTAALRREIAGMQAVFDAPMFFKNLTCACHIGFLAAAIPHAVFLDLVRSELCTAESILKARQDALGNLRDWWSLRPAEYVWLRDLDAYEQIAGQILCTRRRIEQQLEALPAAQVLRLTYEALCTRPAAGADALAATLEALGSPAGRRGDVPASFDYRDADRPLPHRDRFEAAFAALRHRLDSPREEPRP